MRKMTDSDKKLLDNLYAKCDGLDAYSEALQQTTHQDDLQNLKADILSGLASKVRSVLSKTTPDLFDASTLATQIRDAMNEACPPVSCDVLAEHRAPVLRWINEIMAMIGTLFVGTLVKTGLNMYESYSANPENFSLSNVPFGFFSHTESVNKVVALINTVETLESLDESEQVTGMSPA